MGPNKAIHPAPMEPFATPSTTMARASKVWLGNGLPLRCNILRGEKITSFKGENQNLISWSTYKVIYLYYLTYVYSVYINILCIYGWITIKLSYSTNFQTPRIKKSNIFTQSPRDSPKVFPRTATCTSADGTQLIAEESFYPAWKLRIPGSGISRERSHPRTSKALLTMIFRGPVWWDMFSRSRILYTKFQEHPSHELYSNWSNWPGQL